MVRHIAARGCTRSNECDCSACRQEEPYRFLAAPCNQMPCIGPVIASFSLPPARSHYLMEKKSMVGLENRTSRLELQSQGLRFRDPGLRCRDPGLSLRDPSLSFRGPGLMFRDPRVSFRNPGLNFRYPGLRFRDPGLRFKGPGVSVKEPCLTFKDANRRTARSFFFILSLLAATFICKAIA